MNINLTLIGQSIVFALFVWFTMKFVWPPIMTALTDRKKAIADGIAAGERGAHEKELAQKRAIKKINEAKQEAQEIIAQAQKRASEIVEAAKGDARTEGERLITAANAEIEQEVNRAREALRGQVATLVVSGASKILKREVDAAANEDILNDLVAQL
ncbi:MAG: F0F1 ATP synthase subunit B [Gammaproteobacteria bacterium]